MRAQSPSPAPSSFWVIYKMGRECAWCLEVASKLAEVIYCNVENGICFFPNSAISLTLRTARKFETLMVTQSFLKRCVNPITIF